MPTIVSRIDHSPPFEQVFEIRFSPMEMAHIDRNLTEAERIILNSPDNHDLSTVVAKIHMMLSVWLEHRRKYIPQLEEECLQSP